MRTLRLPSLAVAIAFTAGCSQCGSRPPPPTERFVAADAAAVFIVPSLAALAQQSSDVLATAVTFQGGKELLDARAVIAGRLTFDPFDAASIASSGLDPARGLALSGVIGKGGESSPDLVLSLPIADAKKFEAAVTRLAQERLSATARDAEGAPQVVVWREAAGGEPLFAYALVERTAIVSFGQSAMDAVRTALAIPAAATIASRPEYQRTMKALGDGLGFEFYVPAGSPALKEVPQLKDGFAAGVRGGRDRIGVAAAMLLGPREAAYRDAVAKGESAALLSKLDPGAACVARGDGNPSLTTDLQGVADAMTKQGIPAPAIAILKDFVGALGSGSALGIGLLPPDPKAKGRLAEAPLAALRAEVLASLSDPDRMTAAIQRAVDLVTEQATASRGAGAKAKAAPRPSFGKNPWRLPLAGGEIAAAVADGKLAIALGPTGSLEALLARSGTTFKAPTPAAEKALHGGTGGMFLDVPKLAAAARSYPEAAFGAGQQGVMLKSMVDQWSNTAARVTAVSLSSALVEGAVRSELLVEVAPAPSPAPASK
ncbi:MAG: hypothetical protein WCC48_09775 [Anaeromyxobacteraceae bacterium]